MSFEAACESCGALWTRAGFLVSVMVMVAGGNGSRGIGLSVSWTREERVVALWSKSRCWLCSVTDKRWVLPGLQDSWREREDEDKEI